MATVQQQDWKAGQLAFMDWLATPRNYRDASLPTQEAVAEKIGVTPKTLTVWKRIPGFVDAVYMRAKYYMGSHVSGVLGALAAEAESGDVPAIKLYLQVCGLWQPGMDRDVALIVFGADQMQRGYEAVKEYERWRLAEIGNGSREDANGSGQGA